MSSCMVCHLDSKKHSKKLWELHQQSQICAFCKKNASEHSEKLWQMHEFTVEKGQRCSAHCKNEKLYPITIGLGRTTISRVCRFGPDPDDVKLIPIYLSCAECGLYLADIEEENADILGQMCLKCFGKQTGQTTYWYNPNPVAKEDANC